MDKNDSIKVKESILQSLQKIVRAKTPITFYEMHTHALRRGQLGLQKEYLLGLTDHLVKKRWVNEVESGLYLCADAGTLETIIQNNRRGSLRKLMNSISNGSKREPAATVRIALSKMDPDQKTKVMAVITALKKLDLGKGLTRMEMFDGADLSNGWQHGTVKALLASGMMLKTGERRDRRYWSTERTLDVDGIVRVLWPDKMLEANPAEAVKMDLREVNVAPVEAEVEAEDGRPLKEELQEALEQFMEIAEYQAARIERLEGTVEALLGAFEAFATELGSPEIAKALYTKFRESE